MKAQTTSKMRSSSSSPASAQKTRTRRLLLAGGVFLLAALVIGVGPAVEAASVVVGGSPIDTVYSADGSACYVLDTATSSVVVVDPVEQIPLATFTLPVAPGLCRDIDFHQASWRVHIGCSNAGLLTWGRERPNLADSGRCGFGCA